MARYEYKVVPAPTKGVRAPGIKGNDARVAYALEQVMNEYGADGWEYIRADTLPFEERSRLTRVETKYKNLLVFRRAMDGSVRTWSPAPVATVVVPQPAPALAATATVIESDKITPPVTLKSVAAPQTSQTGAQDAEDTADDTAAPENDEAEDKKTRPDT